MRMARLYPGLVIGVYDGPMTDDSEVDEQRLVENVRKLRSRTTNTKLSPRAQWRRFTEMATKQIKAEVLARYQRLDSFYDNGEIVFCLWPFSAQLHAFFEEDGDYYHLILRLAAGGANFGPRAELLAS